MSHDHITAAAAALCSCGPQWLLARSHAGCRGGVCRRRPRLSPIGHVYPQEPGQCMRCIADLEHSPFTGRKGLHLDCAVSHAWRRLVAGCGCPPGWEAGGAAGRAALAGQYRPADLVDALLQRAFRAYQQVRGELPVPLSQPCKTTRGSMLSREQHAGAVLH